MYVLDTNIVSEITKPNIDANVLAWLQDFSDESYLTAVTVLELNYGIMRLPDGKRKTVLREHVDAIVRDCASRILDFDSFSAYLCADLRCKAQALGRTPGMADCMIAAICKRHDATLVTHNVKDFDYVDDLRIVDPFMYESPILQKLRARERDSK